MGLGVSRREGRGSKAKTEKKEELGWGAAQRTGWSLGYGRRDRRELSDDGSVMGWQSGRKEGKVDRKRIRLNEIEEKKEGKCWMQLRCVNEWFAVEHIERHIRRLLRH